MSTLYDLMPYLDCKLMSSGTEFPPSLFPSQCAEWFYYEIGSSYNSIHIQQEERIFHQYLHQKSKKVSYPESLQKIYCMIGTYALYQSIKSMIQSLWPNAWDLLNCLSQGGPSPGAEDKISFPQSTWASQENGAYGTTFRVFLTKENGGRIFG